MQDKELMEITIKKQEPQPECQIWHLSGSLPDVQFARNNGHHRDKYQYTDTRYGASALKMTWPDPGKY